MFAILTASPHYCPVSAIFYIHVLGTSQNKNFDHSCCENNKNVSHFVHQVKLMNQVKDESMKVRRVEQRRSKEMAQFKKEQRQKDNQIRSLEAETKIKDVVIRRKKEEVSRQKVVLLESISKLQSEMDART